MYRVGIIGTENSHAGAFVDLFSRLPEYSDIKVTHIAGMYDDANKTLQQKHDWLKIVTPEKMLGEVDAVMVTARDGKYHAGFAQPFVEAGIPLFMDKPFCMEGDQALELVRLAKSKNVPITGGSSLKSCYDILMLENKVNTNKPDVKGGTIIAPLSMHNDYSGFYFYSSHLAEMILKVFGYNPLEVTARRNGDCVTAIVKYDSFNVCAQLIEGCYEYFGQVVLESGIHSRRVDIALGYKHECDEFANMLRTGKMAHSYEQLIKPVFLLNAIFQSYNTDTAVKVKDFII